MASARATARFRAVSRDGFAARVAVLAGIHPQAVRTLRWAFLGVALLVEFVLAGLSIRQWAMFGIERPLALDFALYRACSIQGIQHSWSQLYDVNIQRQVYQAQGAAYRTAGTMALAPNVCTPLEGWLTLSLAVLPLPAGSLIRSVLIFAATAFAFWTLAPGPCSPSSSRS